MDRPASLLVEFLGAPGVGKTTVARHALAKLKQEEISARFPVDSINNEMSVGSRITAKVPYATFGWWHDTASLDYLGQIWSGNAEPNILFNWLFVQGVTQWHLRQPGVTLIDQGMIQAVWSFQLRDSDVANFYRHLLLRNYPSQPTLIVQVEAAPNIIHSRLGNRTDNQSAVGPEEAASFSVQEALQAYDKIKDTVQSITDSREPVCTLTLQNNKTEQLETGAQEVVQWVKSF